MSNFKHVFRFQAKQYLNKWTLGLFVALFLVMAFFGMDGIGDYNMIVKNRGAFQKKKKNKFDSHIPIQNPVSPK
ncbi:MAG: hypothetical protein GY940_25805, partial [bacterium]|nr:hypothetical protein [bacterium]